MGYSYRLKPVVINYIVSQKSKYPEISCRNLTESVSKEFGFRISKSSISCVLSGKKLSSPVGRRPKRRIETEGDLEHGGFSMLLGVDNKFSVSKIIAKALINLLPSLSNSILEDVEDTVQGLTIFRSIFNLTIESTRCYNNKEIWSLVGWRPTRSSFDRVIGALESSQLKLEELVTEMDRFLIPVSGFRFILSDSSIFFIDAQLQSIWTKPQLKGNYCINLYSAICYIDSFIKEKQRLSIFSVQTQNLFSQEILDFITALNGQNNNKRLSQIDVLGRDGNTIETRSVGDQKERYFFLGFWPWQLEAVSGFERKPSSNKFDWEDLGVKYYYQIEEVLLPQLAASQDVMHRVILLRNTPEGAIRMGILTNIPSDKIHNYLSFRDLCHWMAPEESYKEFIGRDNKERPENLLPDDFDSWISLEVNHGQRQSTEKISDIGALNNTQAEENNLNKIFAVLSQIIFRQFQQKFLSKSCGSWGQFKIKDVFLRQRAKIKSTKEYKLCNIMINNELCRESDMKYICQRLNKVGLFDINHKLPLFTYTPKQP